jgi:hypothetical protein
MKSKKISLTEARRKEEDVFHSNTGTLFFISSLEEVKLITSMNISPHQNTITNPDSYCCRKSVVSTRRAR